MSTATETQYGFRFGPALVERWCSDDKRGWVVIGIKTQRFPHGVQVCVTKTGMVRVNGVKVEK